MFLAFLLALNYPPVGNQLPSWNSICLGIADGTFLAKSGTPTQCSSLPNRIVSWADVAGAVNTSGCPTGNPLPTWQGVINCRIVSSTINPTIDPFLINGNTNWVNATGPPVYTALPTSSIPGQPAGAQYISSTGSSSIQQQIFGSTAPLVIGTPIVVRAYLRRASSSFTDNGTTLCPGTGFTTTVTSIAQVQIVAADTTVMVTTLGAINGSYSQISASTSTTSSQGYYVLVRVSNLSQTVNKAIEVGPIASRSCSTGTQTITATAGATGITASST